MDADLSAGPKDSVVRWRKFDNATGAMADLA